MKKIVLSLCLFSISALPACGFQLRGTGQTIAMDLGDVYVSGSVSYTHLTLPTIYSV